MARRKRKSRKARCQNGVVKRGRNKGKCKKVNGRRK